MTKCIIRLTPCDNYDIMTAYLKNIHKHNVIKGNRMKCLLVSTFKGGITIRSSTMSNSDPGTKTKVEDLVD